ncbi:acylneuraminate cytidylyltransferase family protein [Sulfurimonas sp. NW7]|uniref:acylneuraminate cytidylyltransferase family protein n=1 Tax=Sulfurimonas sp. NW7 TaxID=2922727 RepID=UPI003DA9F95C
MKKVLAIIPARGNSKGLKNKNIYPLNKKELILYTIEAAKNSKYITDVYVNSDSHKILDIARNCQIKTYQREAELALDDTKTQDVVYDMLRNIDKKYDTVILLQPTSPLRDAKDIDEAFDLYYSSQATSLISMSVPKHSPFKAFTLNEDNYLTGIVNNDYPFMPRQKLPTAYYPNGAIYIFGNDIFLKTKEFFSDKTIPYIMNETKSIDIDSIEDIMLAEQIIQNT